MLDKNLIVAAETGDIETLRKIGNHSNIYKRDDDGNLLTMIAIQNGHKDFYRACLEMQLLEHNIQLADEAEIFPLKIVQDLSYRLDLLLNLSNNNGKTLSNMMPIGDIFLFNPITATQEEGRRVFDPQLKEKYYAWEKLSEERKLRRVNLIIPIVTLAKLFIAAQEVKDKIISAGERRGGYFMNLYSSFVKSFSDNKKSDVTYIEDLKHIAAEFDKYLKKNFKNFNSTLSSSDFSIEDFKQIAAYNQRINSEKQLEDLIKLLSSKVDKYEIAHMNVAMMCFPQLVRDSSDIGKCFFKSLNVEKPTKGQVAELFELLNDVLIKGLKGLDDLETHALYNQWSSWLHQFHSIGYVNSEDFKKCLKEDHKAYNFRYKYAGIDKKLKDELLFRLELAILRGEVVPGRITTGLEQEIRVGPDKNNKAEEIKGLLGDVKARKDKQEVYLGEDKVILVPCTNINPLIMQTASTSNETSYARKFALNSIKRDIITYLYEKFGGKDIDAKLDSKIEFVTEKAKAQQLAAKVRCDELQKQYDEVNEKAKQELQPGRKEAVLNELEAKEIELVAARAEVKEKAQYKNLLDLVDRLSNSEMLSYLLIMDPQHNIKIPGVTLENNDVMDPNDKNKLNAQRERLLALIMEGTLHEKLLDMIEANEISIGPDRIENMIEQNDVLINWIQKKASQTGVEISPPNVQINLSFKIKIDNQSLEDILLPEAKDDGKLYISPLAREILSEIQNILSRYPEFLRSSREVSCRVDRMKNIANNYGKKIAEYYQQIDGEQEGKAAFEIHKDKAAKDAHIRLSAADKKTGVAEIRLLGGNPHQAGPLGSRLDDLGAKEITPLLLLEIQLNIGSLINKAEKNPSLLNERLAKTVMINTNGKINGLSNKKVESGYKEVSIDKEPKNCLLKIEDDFRCGLTQGKFWQKACSGSVNVDICLP